MKSKQSSVRVFLNRLWPVIREGLLMVCLALGANQAAHLENVFAMIALTVATAYQARRFWLTKPHGPNGPAQERRTEEPKNGN